LSIAALMVGFGIPFDMFSMLVGAIALGLAVDDTVHFMQ
jgi:predicted RND superfamily exporter protein